MELDWSVGQILDAIKRNGLDDNTFVMFTSDNGPWLNYGNHAGSAGPLREGKGTMWEGGYREPCVMRWPGKIPADTKCDELASTIDIFPTVARLIGAQVPTERKIDGKDIWPLMSGKPGATSPHDVFYCYYDRQLRGRPRSALQACPPARIPQPQRQTGWPRRRACRLRATQNQSKLSTISKTTSANPRMSRPIIPKSSPASNTPAKKPERH